MKRLTCVGKAMTTSGTETNGESTQTDNIADNIKPWLTNLITLTKTSYPSSIDNFS